MVLDGLWLLICQTAEQRKTLPRVLRIEQDMLCPFISTRPNKAVCWTYFLALQYLCWCVTAGSISLFPFHRPILGHFHFETCQENKENLAGSRAGLLEVILPFGERKLFLIIAWMLVFCAFLV